MIREKLLSAIDVEMQKTGISDRALSVKATGSTDTIRNIRRGAYPRIDTAESLLNALGMSIEVIGSHQDENRVQKRQDQQGKILNLMRENQENTYAVSTVAAPFDPAIHKSEHVLVPKLAVRASAGHGAINDHERPEHLLAFRRDWFRKHGLSLDRLGAIEVNGDSMEPTLLDGETILINCGCAMPPPLETLVVARVNDDALVVKRLYKWDDDYMLLSDNRIYRPIKLTPDDEIIGEVVWRGVWIARPTGE